MAELCWMKTLCYCPSGEVYPQCIFSRMEWGHKENAYSNCCFICFSLMSSLLCSVSFLGQFIVCSSTHMFLSLDYFVRYSTKKCNMQLSSSSTVSLHQELSCEQWDPGSQLRFDSSLASNLIPFGLSFFLCLLFLFSHWLLLSLLGGFLLISPIF